MLERETNGRDAAVEQIVLRKVVAFASGVDPNADHVFEMFAFEPRDQGSDGDGAAAS